MHESDIELKAIGILIRLRRQKENLSQDGLATEMGISRATMNRVELGKHSTSIITMLKILKKLNISMEDISSKIEQVKTVEEIQWQ